MLTQSTTRVLLRRRWAPIGAPNTSIACRALTISTHPPASFDLSAIRRAKPFGPWLIGEMRSNHAGETGAVSIYDGALWALDARRTVKSGSASDYEDALVTFSRQHRDSEQGHLDLLEEVLDDNDKSRLLPAWRVAGFTLGVVSTVFCPRGMYLTTEAVEAFVEEHYGEQIRRLKLEVAKSKVEETNGDKADNSSVVAGKKELISMLEHCCAEEVHHKEEARNRAAEGPLPWFSWVDTSWQSIVGVGSFVAAGFAKRI